MSASDAIAAIGLAYPNRHFDEETAELYARMLRNLDAGMVERAIERLINGSDFMPTIHAIKREVAEEALGLPTPEEAWDIVTRGDLKRAPVEVIDAARACGGRQTIMHTDNLPTVRAQFLKSYTERRASVISEYVGARPPVNYRRELPPGQEIGMTMAALPPSERVAAPPVIGRAIERMLGHNLDVPTEEEKRAAIEILRDGPPEHGDPDFVYLEAERIFMEAGE